MDQQTKDEVDRTAQRLEAALGMFGGKTNQSVSTITVNGGTWVSYLALCLVMVNLAVVALACLFIAFQLSDLRRQDETFQAYINAGYVQPEAKEEETK